MSGWSGCDIRLLVVVTLSFACFIVGMTHSLYKVHNELKKIRKLLTNLPNNQGNLPNSNGRQSNKK